MRIKLLANLHDLLRQCIIEGERIQYKAGSRRDHPRQCSMSKIFVNLR